MIQLWAMEHAREIGVTNFRASSSWLARFKKKHRYGSRQISKKTSRAKEKNKAKIESSKFEFLDRFERQRIRFHDGLIFNFDQSGFEYEMSSGRTLSFIGERDTYGTADQSNKQTHSYTIQPTISRDGKTLGNLLVCLQEAKGEFGPKIAEKVRELEGIFGNIHVVASSSGKMSVALMKKWVSNTLIPPIQDLAQANPPPAQAESEDEYQDEPQPSCSWAQVETECPDHSQGRCSQLQPNCPQSVKPTGLVIADSWGGNINKDVQALLKDAGIQFLQIPEGTTDQLQPCDIELFRQWKYFARRLTM